MQVKELQFQGIQFLDISYTETYSSDILIITPGIGAFKENYLSYAQSFQKQFGKIIILSLPSQGSKGKWSIGSITDTLAIIIKEYLFTYRTLHHSKVFLTGHSAGAVGSIMYVLGYSQEIESLLCGKSLDKLDIKTNAKIKDALSKNDRCEVEGLMLLSPINNFREVFKPFILKNIKKCSEFFIKCVLHMFVNIPTYILGKLIKNSECKQLTISYKKTQYCALINNSHKPIIDHFLNFIGVTNFVNLLLEYSKTISDNNSIKKLLSSFYKINKYVIMGELDWVARTSFSKKRGLINYIRDVDNTEVYVSNKLGHFLSSRWSLDLNLNSQMLNNDIVVNKCHYFIKKCNRRKLKNENKAL